MPLLRLANRVGGILMHPAETFEIIIHERIGIAEPFLLVVAFEAVQGGLIGALVLGLLRIVLFLPSPLPGFSLSGLEFFAGLLNLVPYFSAGLFIAQGVVLWLIWAIAAHLGAKHLFQGGGEFFETMKLLGYTIIPNILIIVGLFIGFANALAALFITSGLGIVALIWRGYLGVVAVQCAHGIDGGKAFIAAILIPLAALIVIGGAPFLLSLLLFR